MQVTLKNKLTKSLEQQHLQPIKARIPLAKMAVEESGMGVVEDKIIKNHFASEYIYNKFRDAKTCGILEEDKVNGIKK